MAPMGMKPPMPPMGGGGMAGAPPMGMPMGEPDGDEMSSPLLMALMSQMGGIQGQSLGVDLTTGGPGDPGMGLAQLLEMLAMSQGGMGGTDPSLGGMMGPSPGMSGAPQIGGGHGMMGY